MTEAPSYEDLAARLALAEQTLEAIRRGEVDALVVSGAQGPRVFTLETADAFYRALVEQMPLGAAAVRPDGSILYANRAFGDVFGVGADALVGRDLRSFASGGWRELLEDLLTPVGGEGDLVLAAPGADVPVAISVRAVAEDPGGALCVVAVDLTQRRAAERAVYRAEERFQRAFDNALIGMALLDLKGRAVRVNPSLCDILDRRSEELIGAPLPWLAADPGVPGVLAALADGSRDHVSLERETPHADGRSRWAALMISPVRDDDGSPLHYLAQVQDVSDQRLHEERLRHVADHDGLTGLLNRRGFEAAMARHLTVTDRYGAEGALILCDIDHFKYINDARGHQVGDAVLSAVATALRERLRSSDVLARLGGDEFAVLIPRGDATAARAVAGDILAAVRALRPAELVGLRPLTVSIGIALADDTKRSAGELLAVADLAMYDAKEAGRDRVELYVPGTQAHGSETEHRMTWLGRITRALDDDALALHAQPIVALEDGAVVGHELLVRMPSVNGPGVVPAAVWFDVAERYDLAMRIDEWVLAQALELLADDRRTATGLSVNVSATSIGRSRLLDQVRDGLAGSRVRPERLTFEVTETAAIANIASAARFAEQLHALGCRLALDDFGAGFGSFYYLKHLPFDDVKIDGEFVRNSVNDDRDKSIIRAMVDVARSMDRRTVAECIEDAGTLALMRSHGVDLAQGYHLGLPGPVADLAA